MNCLVSFFFYVIATTRVTATGYTTGYNWIQHATNVHYNVDIYEPERGSRKPVHGGLPLRPQGNTHGERTLHIEHGS